MHKLPAEINIDSKERSLLVRLLYYHFSACFNIPIIWTSCKNPDHMFSLFNNLQQADKKQKWNGMNIMTIKSSHELVFSNLISFANIIICLWITDQKIKTQISAVSTL